MLGFAADSSRSSATSPSLARSLADEPSPSADQPSSQTRKGAAEAPDNPSASRTAIVASMRGREPVGQSTKNATPRAATASATPTATLLIAQRLRRRRGRHAPGGIEAGEQRGQQRQRDALEQDPRRWIDRHRPAERAAVDDEDEDGGQQQAARHGQHAGEQSDH